jgi:hypothetical protein
MRPGLSLKVLLSAVWFAGCVVSVSHADENTWKVGIARAVITPQTPVWLAGYGTKRVPEGKVHDLWLKVLAFQASDGHRVVLITSDFQGVPKSMSDRVFEQLEKQFQLGRQDVMFAFSHNHCGPRLGDDLQDYYPVEPEQEKLVAEYTDRMVDLTVATVGQALAALAPARVYEARSETTFAVNRRNNKESDVPRLLEQGIPLRGPVDHQVPVLIVTALSGELRGILFGYACHPTTLSFNYWCGDYPGFAQEFLEERYPGAIAMFVNTCGGDQNPLPRRQLELCRKYGQMLADAVQKALADPASWKEIPPQAVTAFRYVELSYDRVVTREELQQAAASPRNAIHGRWAQRLLRMLDKGTQFTPTYPYPIHVWRLGDETLFIGMGAETVVDYALQLKTLFGPRTWVLGYTDDMIAYIPSRRVWEEGGYEGGDYLYEYGRPAYRWAGDIESRIVSTVRELVAEVRTRPTR